MISSLVLIFLWFTTISWWLKQNTFGQEAFLTFGEAISLNPMLTMILLFYITLIFTLIYIQIIRKYMSLI